MTAMPRTRRAVAVVGIALIVFAALVPLGGLSLEWLIVTPGFVRLPPITASAVIPHDCRCDECVVSLLASLDSRGPPSRSSLS